MTSDIKSINSGQYISSLLKETGGSSGMEVDGSITPVPFFFTAPGNMLLGRIHFYLEGNMNFSAITFANLAALTNGAQLLVGGVEIDNFKDNTDLLLSSDIIGPVGRVFASEQRSLAWIWTFHECIGGADGILLAAGAKVEMIIRDDLSTLAIFRTKIQGALIGD